MRASVYDIVKADEGQHIIDHGIFKEVDDLYEMQQDAAIISPYIYEMIDARRGLKATVTPIIFNAEKQTISE